MSQDSFLSSDFLTPDAQNMLLEDNDVQNLVNNINWSSEHQFDSHLMGMINPAELIDIKPTMNVLSDEEYAGPYNFEVTVCPNGTKNPWVYSVKLNKVFMDMAVQFPVDFRLNVTPDFPLFVRATPIFCQPQHVQENVYRCYSHVHATDATNQGVPENVRHHVIRCTSNANANYMGSSTNNERLSVLIPLQAPQTGTDSVRELFVFMCKNSCPYPGMNRKPIEVIFTLENVNGDILGRKVLMVRICSCPKRDKEKEEKESEKSSAIVPKGKKRKLDAPKIKNETKTEDDKKEYNMISIVGRKHYLAILEMCTVYMKAELYNCSQTGQSDEKFKNSLNTLNSLIKKYKNSE